MKASHVIGGLAGVFAVVFGAVYTSMALFDMRKDKSPSLMVSSDVPVIENAQAGGVPNDFTAAAEQILKSVVSITSVFEGQGLFGRVESSGSGSGVVVSKDGYIVTNNHVIAARGTSARRVLVKWQDGTTAEATVVGTDPRSDLAVLKVDRTDLVPATFGESSALKPGEWVIAAGSPLGFENTISVGVVSSLNRPLRSLTSAIFVDGIQTDAAINKGNSGGALCDAEGRLVGINTAIATTDQGSIGIGFAIPVDRARKVIDDIIKFGQAQYGDPGITLHRLSQALGVEQGRRELAQIVGSSSLPPQQGAIVDDVARNALAAGLRRYDVITEANGQPVRENTDFYVLTADASPGEELRLKVWSAGETKTVTVRLGSTIGQ